MASDDGDPAGERLRFNAELAAWEYEIARRPEVDIEADVWSALQLQDQGGTGAWLAEQRYALGVIDRWKVAEVYEAERDRLRSLLPPALLVPDLDLELLKQFDNFTNGLRSPDLEQRARFQAAADAFADPVSLDGRSKAKRLGLLAAFERSSRLDARGRSYLAPPWRNHVPELDMMRLLCARDGVEVLDAARQANEAYGQSRSGRRHEKLVPFYEDRRNLRG